MTLTYYFDLDEYEYEISSLLVKDVAKSWGVDLESDEAEEQLKDYFHDDAYREFKDACEAGEKERWEERYNIWDY